MSKSKLFIPDKITAGFQNRADTYEGKLAYVTYWDKKGVLRKEWSWDGWRDNRIDPVILDNTPTSGFVLNKGVGGPRASWGRNARNEYIRIWDPRGVEFEISVPNLVYLMLHVNVVKSQIQGDLVYAWSGKDLLLLPTVTDDYKSSVEYTKAQGSKVSARTLVKGGIYQTKNLEEYVYLGRFEYNYVESTYRNDKKYIQDKRHIFIDTKNNNVVPLKSMVSLSSFTESSVDDYSKWLDIYKNSIESSKIVEFFSEAIDTPEIELPSPGYYGDFIGYVETYPGTYRIISLKMGYRSDSYTLEKAKYLSFNMELGEFSKYSTEYGYKGIHTSRYDILHTMEDVSNKLASMDFVKIMCKDEFGNIKSADDIIKHL